MLLKLQILEPYPRPTKSESLGMGPNTVHFTLKFENHCALIMVFTVTMEASLISPHHSPPTFQVPKKEKKKKLGFLPLQ